MFPNRTLTREWADVTTPRERTTACSLEAERTTLLSFLSAQRQSVLAIIEGLDEAALRQTVVPSGWTPLGMIEHLADAERFWFQRVVSGQAGELPCPRLASEADEEDGPFTSAHPVDAVLAFYRDQCAHTDAILATTPLTAVRYPRT